MRSRANRKAHLEAGHLSTAIFPLSVRFPSAGEALGYSFVFIVRLTRARDGNIGSPAISSEAARLGR